MNDLRNKFIESNGASQKCEAPAARPVSEFIIPHTSSTLRNPLMRFFITSILSHGETVRRDWGNGVNSITRFVSSELCHWSRRKDVCLGVHDSIDSFDHISRKSERQSGARLRCRCENYTRWEQMTKLQSTSAFAEGLQLLGVYNRQNWGSFAWMAPTDHPFADWGIELTAQYPSRLFKVFSLRPDITSRIQELSPNLIPYLIGFEIRTAWQYPTFLLPSPIHLTSIHLIQ